MDESAFEHARLGLFRDYGFDGQSRWFTDADGRRTYAIARGEAACPTVLVHGGMADASVWYRVAGRLPGAVVVLDRPGHGLSYAIDYSESDYRAAAADWLLHVADSLGAPRIDLVGNSMGGFFAMAFAVAHPERVRRLVLAGAPAGLDRWLPMFIRLWGRAITGPLISAMVTRTTDPEALRKRVMTGLCAHPEAIAVEALQIAAAASSRPDWGRTVQTMLHTVSDFGGWRRELDMREPMATLKVPTLFVWGDKDSFAPPSSGQELAARMPAASVEVIEDAGHLLQLDQPAALAEAITRFLA